MVTGAAEGLGFAIAASLAQAGAAVGVLDINADRADEAATALRNTATAPVCAVQADVAVQDAMSAAIDAIAGALGPIDILISSAGIWRQNTLMDVTEAEWDRVLAVNVKGALWGAQLVAPAMIDRRSGKIINIASLAGVGPGLNWAAYQTSKAAMIMFSRILAAELEPHDVQVNTVCPGAIRTPMLKAIVAAEGGDFAHAADPADVADAIMGLIAPFDQTTTDQVVDGHGKSIL